MATVYSLICWGGSAGKSVTASSTTDLITLTNHGLRNATGVCFKSGTLPTVASGAALAVNTTYYAKSISSSTFELYRESSLTTKIDFTSNGSSLVMYSAYYVGLSDKSRWTYLGVEQIYDGLAAWRSARNAQTTRLDSEIAEIAMAYTETVSASVNVSFSCGYAEVTTNVNGSRSPAFHNGAAGSGYVLQGTGTYVGCLSMAVLGGVVDGIEVRHSGTDTTSGITLNNLGVACRHCIAIGGGVAVPSSSGFQVNFNYTTLTHCLAYGWLRGVYINDYKSSFFITNCTVTKNGTGFAGVTYTSTAGTFINNLSYGNTTANWQSTVYGFTYAHLNAGGSGEAWTTTGATRIELSDTSPYTNTFVDWTNADFNLASGAAALIEVGSEYYGAPAYDLSANRRPAYPGSAYNTAVTAGSFVAGLSYTIVSVGTTDFTAIGASANTVGVTFKATGVGTGTGTATLNAKIDIGAYEFDLGYGAWPATFTLTIDNVVSGSAIRLEESDGTLIEFRTATSTSEVFTMSAALGTVTIKIRKGTSATKYLPYETQTTAFDGSASIYVLQTADTIAA